MKKFTKYPSKSVTSSTHLPPICKLAESIVDDMSEFLDATTHIENISDYLDSDDLDNIMKASDALNEFVNAYYFDNN